MRRLISVVLVASLLVSSLATALPTHLPRVFAAPGLSEGAHGLFPGEQFPVGSGPTSVALGDLDGDGNLDIVTANYWDNNVSVLSGNGDGIFAAQSVFAAGDGPESVALGDLDGDGDLDIVSANSDDDTVSLLLGNGDGTFAAQSAFAVGDGPESVALGDLDGDGNLDIVSANSDDDTVSLLLGNGDGTFATQSTFPAGSVDSYPFCVALGDLDEDGNLDIVTANRDSSNVSVLPGMGDGTFAPQSTFAVGNGPYSVALGDLDGDGDLDIVSANAWSNTVSVLLGNGHGTFAAQSIFPVGGGPWSVALGDLDGDDNLDIVTTNCYDDTVSVLLGNGHGTFAAQSRLAVGCNPVSVALGDLDGDDNLDIVTANANDDTVSMLPGSGDGTFAPQSTFAVGDLTGSVALGDLDGDGDLDVVTANRDSSNVSVLPGSGDGTFAPQSTFPVGGGPVSVALGDLDGDGNLDIVTANRWDDTLSVLLGSGAGTFAAQSLLVAGNWPTSVALGDLDGDGDLDIVSANSDDDTVSLLLGNGDGTFTAQSTFPVGSVGSCPFCVALGDLDGDGNLDVVVANYGGGNVSVLLGNGDGTFAAQSLFVAGNWPTSVALGDLNEDGYLDIATANGGNNNVSVLLQTARLCHSPRGFTSPPVGAVTLHFPAEMDMSSFSIFDDINSFTGPSGNITVAGFSWADPKTLILTFEPQWAVGRYEISMGPDIVDIGGSPMGDIYLANFVIRAPAVVGRSPSGYVTGPVGALRFKFSHAMDTISFSIAEDIGSFSGPSGDIAASGFSWPDAETLEVTFDPQCIPGSYQMVVGPQILDLDGNAMDQDEDLIPGENPDDVYVAAFIVEAPRVVGHTPAGNAPPPVNSIRFEFDCTMDETSFSLADDIVGFIGPDGSVTPTGYSWVDTHTLEVTFDPQWSVGDYQMLIGPQITDWCGNAMDQDGDLVVGETSDDQYTADFTLAYSGTVSQDTTWGPEHGPIAVDGTLTVASGVALTIEAGTVVKFLNTSSGISVQGTLNVHGVNDDAVVLTSWLDDTAGGDTNGDGEASSPAAGDWQGLTFCSSTAVGMLENVEIRYSNRAIHGSAGGATVEIRSAVLRNGVYGVYVYTPYVEIEAENCLIVDNTSRGVYVRASSSEVFRNCNIVGNAAGIHLGAATLTLENTIVAFNGHGLDHSGDPPSLVVRNSDFYNPAGQEILWDGDPGMPQLDQDGNCLDDPLFVDWEAGNYELDASSPCIDSGRGIGAPSQDILGRSRYDDQGMPNTGNGYPCYVDMGTFERQEDTAAGDLAVTYVSGPDPEFVSVGDTSSVEWTVVNAGLLDCTGPWQDVVYLSSDPYISGDDLILVTRVHSEILPPGDSYTETLSITVPSASGPKYVLVHTNADLAFPEADRSNNVGVSSQVLAVDVPLLELGIPQTGAVSAGEWDFYRFEGTHGNSVRFNLDSETIPGSTGLYVRYCMPPTVSEYDASSTLYSQPDQEAKLLEPLDGTYYVGVYGQWPAGGGESYTLSADLTEPGILSASPSLVGNAGNATVEIIGDNFSPDDEVHLVAPDGITELTPLEVYYVDPGHTFATFDLARAEVGMYDAVLVTAQSELATLPNAIEVAKGGDLKFDASISIPGVCRPGRIVDIRIEYSNPSTSDLASPLLTLDSGVENCEWQLPGYDDWVVGPDFRVMALSPQGPATILRPGQTESLVVRMRVPVVSGSMAVTLSSVGAVPSDGTNSPIDWDKLELEIRPAGVDSEIWGPVFAQLQSQIGDTWGDYVQTLRNNAERWFAAGKRVYGVCDLFEMEMDEAYGLPTGIIAGQVIHADSGLPVGGVTVSAENVDTGGRAEALADGDGLFFLYGLDAGECQLGVSRHLVEPGQSIQLPADEDVVDLRVAVIEAGRISGRVTDAASGQLIANGLVSLSGMTTDSAPSTLTDGYGRYEFAELPADTYAIECSAEGYVHRTVEDAEVTLGSATYVDFAMTVGGTINGRIVSSNDGAPIEGANVLATCEGCPPLAAKTDEDGAYSITGLSSGTWRVVAMGDGWVTSEAVDLLVAAPNPVSQDFVLVPGATITGMVTDSEGQPIERATVTAFGEAEIGMAQTDEAGCYEINGLPGGEYSVEARSDRHVSQAIDHQVLSEGQVLTGLDFSLCEGKTVEGIVTEADGVTPIEGAEVHLEDSVGKNCLATTSSDGTFSISVLEPGVYFLQVGASGRITCHKMVEVPALGSLAPLEVSLSSGGSIAGAVTLEDGSTPLANALVTCFRSDVIVEMVLTHPDGTYLISGLPSDTYTVVVSDEMRGFEPAQATVTAPDLSVVNFISGAGVLRGTVTDASDGTPVQDAKVVAGLRGQENEMARTFTTSSDELGRYRFDHLLQGSYWLSVTVDGLARGSAIEAVDPFLGDTTADFALTEALTVCGSVIDATTGEPIEGAKVWLKSAEYPNDDPGLVSLTDECGAYTMPSVAAGNYSIYCQAAGHVRGSEPHVAVSSPGMVLDWSLLSSGATVGGELADAVTGLPIAGWGVVLSGPDLLLSTYTDATGQYSFDTVPVGTWHLSVSRKGSSATATVVVNSLSDEIEQSLAFPFVPNDPVGDALKGLEDVLPMPRLSTKLPEYPKCDYYRNTHDQIMKAAQELGEQWDGLQSKRRHIIRVKEAMSEAWTMWEKESRETWDASLGAIPLFGDLRAIWREILTRLTDRDPDGLPEPPGYLDEEIVEELERTISTLGIGQGIPWGAVLSAERHNARAAASWIVYWMLRAELPGLTNEYNSGVYSYLDDLTRYENWVHNYNTMNGERCEEEEPEPEGDLEDRETTVVFRSCTPEDKFGPCGYDTPDTPAGSEVRYVPAGQTMDYRIEFWNKEDAPVPTQDAIIKDSLDPSVFDLDTFEFTRFGFLKWDEPLSGGQEINTRVDCRPEMNVAVDVTATFNPDTGEIEWWFHCIDPMTGEYPEDPFAGFLPPYNPETGFELGWVEFRVKHKADLPSGTQLANQAFVEFDFLGDLLDHPAPKEGPWINTIDAEPPDSHVNPLNATVEGLNIPVSWGGQDEAGGSGIGGYTVYVSDNGGSFEPWLQNTTLTSENFTGEDGHTYAFYSVARDNVGHIEDAPNIPDATATLNAAASADFFAEPLTGDEPLVVAFTDLSTSHSGIVSWLWDFGDGQTSNEQNPAHTYAGDGVYTVTLTVTEADEDTDTETKVGYITVSDTGPTADFSASPVSGDEPLTVVFTDLSSSYDGITSWLWEFGDGQTSTEQNPAHTYAGDGVYTVTLTVTEADADSDTETKVGYVTVSDTGPTADFSAEPLSGGEPLTVAFTDLSTCHDGIVSWLWDFGDGKTSNEQNPTHWYAEDGDYTVSLTVADNDGNVASKSQVIHVSKEPPSPIGPPVWLWLVSAALATSVLVMAAFLARRRSARTI